MRPDHLQERWLLRSGMARFPIAHVRVLKGGASRQAGRSLVAERVAEGEFTGNCKPEG